MNAELSSQTSKHGTEPLPMVSVVIPMLNEEQFIGKCLDSLIQQDYPLQRIEVLAVNGRSTDQTHAIVHQKSQEHGLIRLLHNARQVTPAALNAGIREATGQVVIILGAHSTVASDFICQNVASLVNSDADCVGGTIQTISPTPVGKAIALAMSCPFGVGDSLFRYYQKQRYVDTVAFAAYRREVFDHIGLFDEELIGAEDDEFNYRLRAHGGRILLCPQIRSWYTCRGNLSSLWKQYFGYGCSKVRVLRKHPRQMRWRQFVPAAFVLAMLGALTLAFLGIFWPLELVAGSYLLADLGASLWVAVRSRLRYLSVLPAIFATLHISYGTGFLIGLVRILCH